MIPIKNWQILFVVREIIIETRKREKSLVCQTFIDFVLVRLITFKLLLNLSYIPNLYVLQMCLGDKPKSSANVFLLLVLFYDRINAIEI